MSMYKEKLHAIGNAIANQQDLCLTERLLKFALKKNSWNTQVFFPIHSFSVHVFIDHLLISLRLEELRQEL